MKMLAKLVAFCVLFAVCSAQRVKLDVYYESLCPDTARFFIDQLHPLKTGPLGRFLDVQLIPFGKATFKTEGSETLFECQHGPNECYGNKVHACAIENIQVDSYQNIKTKESLTLDYVTCLLQTAMQSRDGTFPGFKCARDSQLKNWDVIQQCANSTIGSKFLQDYGERTLQLRPALSEVPTIVFNHQADKELMDFGLRDLRAATCRVLREPKPHECTGYNGAMSNAATYAVVSICAAFVAFRKLF